MIFQKEEIGRMQLIVNGSQTHVVEVSPEANVAQLRAQLSMLEGVDCEQLNLFCSGSPLEDEVNLAALENFTIDLTVPLLGGKVHGSLARAGKVRGQTPKVRRSDPPGCRDDLMIQPMHHSYYSDETSTTNF